MDSTVEEAIDEVRAEHVRAVNATDVDLLLKGMTEDVVYLAPEQPPVMGKDAMRAFIAPLCAQASLGITMTAESVEVSGAQATEWGYARGTMSLDGASPTQVNLAYLLVYRLEPDHGWRISHDISTPGAA